MFTSGRRQQLGLLPELLLCQAQLLAHPMDYQRKEEGGSSPVQALFPSNAIHVDGVLSSLGDLRDSEVK